MSNWMKSYVTLHALMLSGLLLGCDAYDESLLKSAAPPRRPAASTEGPDIAPLTFAIREVVLDQRIPSDPDDPDGEPDLWKSIGFDLDGFDTTSPESTDVECMPPAGDAQPDGHRGIDNNLGSKFYPQLQLTNELANLEQDARDAHDAGRGTFVFYITGYNGERNDPNIDVVIGQAVAGTSASPGEVTFVGGELVYTANGLPAPPPAWEGNDSWFLSDTTFLMSDFTRPILLDPNAYVSNGSMVVHFPVGSTLYFSTEVATVNVKLNEGVAVGPINEDLSGGGPIVIAGRWYKNDIVDTAESAGVCDTTLNDLLATVLNSMVDVTTAPPPDPGPDIECDSLSMGVMFLEAVAAAPGDPTVVANSPALPFACADAGVPDAGAPADGGP